MPNVKGVILIRVPSQATSQMLHLTGLIFALFLITRNANNLKNYSVLSSHKEGLLPVNHPSGDYHFVGKGSGGADEWREQHARTD